MTELMRRRMSAEEKPQTESSPQDAPIWLVCSSVAISIRDSLSVILVQGEQVVSNHTGYGVLIPTCEGSIFVAWYSSARQ